MIETQTQSSVATEKKVFDLRYLSDMMGGKKNLIKEIIDAFLKQVPASVASLNDAVAKTDYPKIRSLAHTMKSSVSIMGISVLAPVLHDMEGFARDNRDIEKIRPLNDQLNLIVNQAIEEIKKEEENYM